MKQVILFVLAAMSINLTAGDFANLNWGMSRNQVEQAGRAAGVKYTRTAQGMEEKAQLAGQPCTCFLYFHKDKLYKAEYLFVFDSAETPNNELFSFYRKFRNLLVKKYGKAALAKKDEPKILEDEEYYNDEDATIAEKKDRMMIGVNRGEVIVRNHWSLVRTYIEISLLSEKKDNSRQTIMRIIYRTKDKKVLGGVKEKAEKSITDRL